MSTFLHYVHCKDALLDCSAPGGERCESLTWVDEIFPHVTTVHIPGTCWNLDMNTLSALLAHFGTGQYKFPLLLLLGFFVMWAFLRTRFCNISKQGALDSERDIGCEDFDINLCIFIHYYMRSYLRSWVNDWFGDCSHKHHFKIRF